MSKLPVAPTAVVQSDGRVVLSGTILDKYRQLEGRDTLPKCVWVKEGDRTRVLFDPPTEKDPSWKPYNLTNGNRVWFGRHAPHQRFEVDISKDGIVVHTGQTNPLEVVRIEIQNAVKGLNKISDQVEYQIEAHDLSKPGLNIDFFYIFEGHSKLIAWFFFEGRTLQGLAMAYAFMSLKCPEHYPFPEDLGNVFFRLPRLESEHEYKPGTKASARRKQNLGSVGVYVEDLNAVFFGPRGDEDLAIGWDREFQWPSFEEAEENARLFVEAMDQQFGPKSRTAETELE